MSFDSTGHAVSLLALVNLAAIPIVLFAIPETRGVDLGGSAEALNAPESPARKKGSKTAG